MPLVLLLRDFEYFAATVPHLVSMLIARVGDLDAPDIPTPRSYAEAINGQPARADLAAPPTWLHWVVSSWYPVEPPAASPRSLPGASRVAQHTKDDACASWVCSSTADPSLFLRTDTLLPPFYVLMYVDDLVFATADTEALALVKARCTITLTQSHMVPQTPCRTSWHATLRPGDTDQSTGRVLRYLCSTLGMRLVLGGRGPVVLIGHVDASWIYAGAMAAQELRWITYLLTDLEERPRSSPILYVDNKGMIALCQEHRTKEHRTKHIALRYFLARELQQRGQLCLAYVASRANTADIFTKAFYGRAVDFEVWLDDLQLFLQCDSKDGLSLFDLTSSASTAPAADADSTVRSQRTTRDAAACLAVRSHLPSTERAHFSQYKSAKTLYDAVVARYSSPATAALSRLMLPYLFPDLAAFATVADLVTHLRTSDARYRAALPTAFLPTNSPPMYITLYYLVTRLPDSLSSFRDHFLSLCPTEMTVDLLEERLAAAEKSILAVGASRGDRRTPFFEGCSPVTLLPSVASAAVVNLVGTEEVGASVSASSGRRHTGKGKGSRGGGGGGGGSGGGGGGGGGGGTGSGGVGGGSGGRGGGGGGSGGGGNGGGGSGGGGAGRGAATQRGGFGGSQRQQQLRTRETPGEVCGLPHTTQRCFGRLTDAWRAQFPDAVELPRWHDLLLQNVPIFDLDFDAILAAMYALADITEGDCYLRVPLDPGTVAAALGASAAAALGASVSAAPGGGTSPLSGTAPTESLHTFTLDSRALPSFFRDSTTLTPLSRPVAVSLADPSGGLVLAHSSMVLPCPAAPSGLLSGLHLPSFSTNLVSGADLQDAWVDQFTPGGQRVTHCACSRTGRHLATFTRRPGSSLYTPTTAPPPVSASCQVAASSQVFAAASRSLLPLPLGPAPTCVPFVEGRQRAAPHSSSFPPTDAPMQTLHMDVWGPAHVRGQGHKRYFLLVVDDYSRYTTVFPLRSKGEVTETFTLPASPQQNGIAERRIGMVMDVARTSMIHAAAPHFLWPFAVQYAAHQINLQPRVSLPETTPTLRWTGKVGDASVFRVWGSRAFVRDTTTDKLSSHAVPRVFFGFPPDAPGCRCRTTVSFPTALPLPPPPPLFLAPDPAEPVEVAVDSGAARGADTVGAGTGGAETGGAESGGAETGGAESGGAETGCAEPGGVAPDGTVSGGAEPTSADSGGALGVPLRREPLSPQRLREWYSRRCRVAAGAAGATGGATGAGAAGGGAGAGAAGGAGGATGAAGGAGAAGGGAGDVRM
ncbi:unnamed protein product [Closterium sp. NIES-53]